MTIDMIDKWVTSFRFNEIKNVSGSPSVTWHFSEVTSIWGVSAVVIFDCSLNVYACGRQKALTMPTYCVAANCNKSQATQNITMRGFPRNQPAMRRKWSNLYNSNKLTLMLRFISHAHSCSEHLAKTCDFVNFMEYQMGFASKRNL